ncbi:MAG: cytochrome c biogenesis protein CcdA [Rectinemataceae bacterium]
MTEPGVVAAFAGGILSFLSPCVLPLVPGYLSYISGTFATDRASGGTADRASAAGSATGDASGAKMKAFVSSLAFSGGFTLAFTVLGIVFSGGALFAGRAGYSRALGIAGGAIVILLGLNMLFDFLKFLNADTRPLGRIVAGKRHGPVGAFLMGLAFAAGWSPCIGPILASILLYAGRGGEVVHAAMLLGAYSLGFALPFIAAGLFFDRMKPLMNFFKRRGREVRIASGLMLIVLGATMAAGSFSSLASLAPRAGYALGAFARNYPAGAKAIDVAVLILLALPAVAGLLKQKSPSKSGTLIRAAWATILVIFAALELSGILSLSVVAGNWLQFTGVYLPGN